MIIDLGSGGINKLSIDFRIVLDGARKVSDCVTNGHGKCPEHAERCSCKFLGLG